MYVVMVKFDVPTGEYNKTEIFKMAASFCGRYTDKEISEIKINSVPKNPQKY